MNKILSLLVVLVLPTLAIASPLQFGRIVDIKGSGFISFDGKTHEIRKGELIFANSEIIVEHSGQVIFTDNADHKFYLGNSSSAAVFAGKVELRSGDVWVQSLNKTDEYKITSANASVSYTGGEAILSYDSVKGKTQLMVINGLMKLANLRSPELNLTVAEGNFSFVDPSFEEGMPRDPTPVGEKTYGHLVAMFPGVSPMDKHSADIFKNDHGAKKAERSIASAHEEPVAHPVAHPVINKDAAALENAYKMEVMKLTKVVAPKKVVHSNVVKKKAHVATPKSNELVVKIYGLAGSAASASTAIYDTEKVVVKNRAPASVSEDSSETVMDHAVPNDMNTNPTTPQYKESEKLIDQLNKL